MLSGEYHTEATRLIRMYTGIARWMWIDDTYGWLEERIYGWIKWIEWYVKRENENKARCILFTKWHWPCVIKSFSQPVLVWFPDKWWLNRRIGSYTSSNRSKIPQRMYLLIVFPNVDVFRHECQTLFLFLIRSFVISWGWKYKSL